MTTDHGDLLADARKTNDIGAADTYKHFIESYALQIWKAADGYEFFLNKRLVDFEGDTQSFLGAEVKETGTQLTWMTTEDMIHIVLPISPEVAVIFCNESRCWESPFAATVHRRREPYPQNSQLVKAPHKDVTNVYVPSMKRGKKYWPATTAWRVNIGTLSRHHHRIITSYSLGHAHSVVLVRSRARFERARRELEAFNRERVEWWQSIGIRSGYRDDRRQRREGVTHPIKDQMDRIVDDHMTALDEVVNIINTTHEKLPRTKENALKSWLAIRTIEISEGITTPSLRSDDTSSSFRIMHPALKATFVAAYPPKHPDHRDLVTIDFGEFLSHAIGDEMFAKLSFEIDKKIGELVHTYTFHSHFEAFRESSLPPTNSLFEERNDDLNEQSIHQEDITYMISICAIQVCVPPILYS